MSIFDDLFADMGGGGVYATMVKAHLDIKAAEGNEEAARLLARDISDASSAPWPGDIVWAKDHYWIWDSTDGIEYLWWSPELRESVLAFDPEEITDVVRHGALIPANTEAALELFEAITWALGTYTLCSRQQNAKTGAHFFRPAKIVDVSDLVDAYRDHQRAASEA